MLNMVLVKLQREVNAFPLFFIDGALLIGALSVGEAFLLTILQWSMACDILENPIECGLAGESALLGNSHQSVT